MRTWAAAASPILRRSASREPRVSESLDAGVNLVSFSGDKLLGGPQAGLISGDAELVSRLRRNPLFRALRLDKLITQALETTLRHMVFERWNEIPALRMIRMTADEIRERAERIRALGPVARFDRRKKRRRRRLDSGAIAANLAAGRSRRRGRNREDDLRAGDPRA